MTPLNGLAHVWVREGAIAWLSSKGLYSKTIILSPKKNHTVADSRGWYG